MLLAAALAAAATGNTAAQPANQAAEHQVKAAFLYKFVGFVEWPAASFARADSPFVIGVAGAPALADELAAIVSGRNVNGRQFAIRRLDRGEAADGHHVLFVGRSAQARGSALLASARGQPVLTVTEAEDGFPAGSIINFVVVDDKVRFDVAARHAEAENLRISARLLAVARKIVASAP